MKRHERVAYWEGHVREYLSSGLTRIEYCRRHGIRTHNLDNWRRKVAQADTGSSVKDSGWVPLKVCDEEKPGTGGAISLRIGCVVVEVEAGFDPRLLSEVLRVVESTCPRATHRQAC